MDGFPLGRMDGSGHDDLDAIHGARARGRDE
jgi:hypothetical protein